MITSINEFKLLLESNENRIVLTVPLLVKIFNDINAECFNNELQNIPLKITRTKNSLGYFKYSRNRTTREVFDMSISISNLFKFTETKLKNIMAHEMIHYWVAMNYNEKEHHGYYFIQNMNRLNKMGYNISVKDDEPDSLDTTTNINSYKYLVCGKYQGSQTAYILVSPSVDIRTVISLFNRYEISDINVYKTKSGKTLQLKTSRKPKVSIIKNQYAYLIDDIINDTENTSVYNI